MWEPVSIPFQSDSLSLPLPLPTIDEIRTCPNILWECYSSKVVAVNDAVVVKFGRMVDASEGQALIYLERYAPEIPAPRLYAMFKSSSEIFLIMQRAPGIQLDKIWPSLTESEKIDISIKLRQVFDDMQQVKCPWPDFFGDLGGGGVQDHLFYSPDTANRYLGPFYGEAAFIAGFIDDQSGRSFDIILVDWANAGWYPGYWEFFRAASPMGFEYGEDDWFWRAQEFLQVWPAELALMRMIDKDNRGY
ncbi:uncharacterized protein ARB_04477 [Trichophyton benhamiae CBS 112371]|uniref:Aminoglycoside phosphotransferase domain-containing protein n=1 Tax=Arthroderma benhamiae (strain ATCC MYA-4681 / CBS 112371) TaxID=663331 RepID=D4AJM7_ARTBC|nr:uncharacterized protein ARB_04477 [Trichophyton benhamiae CBS 112371]EFE36950.1 hypothetical protein ARB_04477 [Trichophyton benhamiae CBS 112371]